MVEVREITMASSSSFRKALLTSTGLAFSVETAHFDEYSVKGPTPAQTALARARGKAQDVAERQSGALVIGADQVLALGGDEFGKVETREEAVARLVYLSGKTHELHSAFTLLVEHCGKIETLHEQIVTVPMTMRNFDEAEAAAYVNDSYEWQGVVGCYQYENNGINLFDSVGGDHSSVIGLPLVPLLRALRGLGINPLLNPRGPWVIPIG